RVNSKYSTNENRNDDNCYCPGFITSGRLFLFFFFLFKDSINYLFHCRIYAHGSRHSLNGNYQGFISPQVVKCLVRFIKPLGSQIWDDLRWRGSTVDAKKTKNFLL